MNAGAFFFWQPWRNERTEMKKGWERVVVVGGGGLNPERWQRWRGIAASLQETRNKTSGRFHGDRQTVIFLKGPLGVLPCDWLMMLQTGHLGEPAHSAALRAARTGCVRLTGPALGSDASNMAPTVSHSDETTVMPRGTSVTTEKRRNKEGVSAFRKRSDLSSWQGFHAPLRIWSRHRGGNNADALTATCKCHFHLHWEKKKGKKKL